MATNLFRKTQSLYASTANTFSTGDSETITPASVAGLPTDTEMTLTFDRVDSSGTETPTKMERIIGVVTGGNFVSRVTTGRGADGSTEQAHTSPVVEYIPNAKDMDDAVDGILVEHTQAGLHKNIATASDVATATNNTKIVTPLAVAPYANNSLNRQAIINGGFTVNQRVYVSNAALASGEYGHDRWKAGAGGGDYTFTQLASSTIITIKAGKTLIQVIEDKNVVGGTYTLSWTGTAQARSGVDTATPDGAYADSPLAITAQTAGTVMSVEFDDGTLGQVQLNSGSVALPFQPKSFAQELADCQRYYFNSKDGATQRPSSFGIGATTATIATNAHFPVSMRAVPTIVIYSYNNTASKVADFGGTTDRGTTVTAAVNNVTRSGFSKINDSGTSFTTANLYWFYFTADAEL